MTKPKAIDRTSRYVRSLSYGLLVMGIGWISILASIVGMTPQQVYAQSHATMPGGNVGDPTIRAVDIAKPASVRIWTDVNGHLTVHFPPTTDVTFPQQANGNYQLSFTGTGTFISSQGDVLTADRVVQPPEEQVLNPALYNAAAQDIADYMNKNAQAGTTPVSVSDVVPQLTSGQLQSTPTYNAPTSRVYLSTDYVGTFTATNLNSVPGNVMATVDTIKVQSPFDQQDLAIVHVPMSDTPSVALGDSGNVQNNDQLTVINFQVNAATTQKPQDFLASSTSSVNVSAKKTSDSGSPQIQISSNVDQGNTGGSPALNSQGQIVGIVSFGSTNGSSNGTNLLQASSSALKLAQSVNLDMTPGSFQQRWGQAFNDYAATTAGHWHKAVQEFTQLAQDYPQFGAVQQFLMYAQTQAQTETINTVSATPTQPHNTGSVPSGTHSSSPAWWVWAIIGGGIVLFLVLAGSLFTVLARKKGQRIVPAPKAETALPIAETKSSEPPSVKSQSLVSEGTGQNTLALKVWPCGHMNRQGARFCSICGEPAPVPPGKK